MKYMKYVIIIFSLAVLLLIVFMFKRHSANIEPEKKAALDDTHIYVTWDTMEFDKCVSAWLIVRFIDKDAQFKFIPAGTQPKEGIPFDIPGAAWSRQHRKCTSQCILESINNTDTAIEAMVSIAGNVELNFWQLDRWPKAQRCFYEVKDITDKAAIPIECFEKTRPYFDKLYNNFKKDSVAVGDM